MSFSWKCPRVRHGVMIYQLKSIRLNRCRINPSIDPERVQGDYQVTLVRSDAAFFGMENKHATWFEIRGIFSCLYVIKNGLVRYLYRRNGCYLHFYHRFRDFVINI